jgi:hypothetical protein
MEVMRNAWGLRVPAICQRLLAALVVLCVTLPASSAESDSVDVDRVWSGHPVGFSLLKWYSLGPNRDRPRTGPLPAPSLLQVETLSTP